MTEAVATDEPTDAELVAYLDGELTRGRRTQIATQLEAKDGVRLRLALLAGGARAFREAFEPLLEQAPKGRLANMLAGLPNYRTSAAAKRNAFRARPRLALVAACLLLLLAGAFADRTLPMLRGMIGDTTSEPEDEWRQAVAGYLTLYTPETLAGVADDRAARERELATLATKLEVALSAETISLPGLALKRAQLLQYDGKALGQIAYVDPRNAPVALCVFADGEPDAAPKMEQRLGLNIVYWSSKGRAFMLIGRIAPARLQPLADELYQRLAS